MEAENLNHSSGRPSRRRFVAISAASAGLALAGPTTAGARPLRLAWRGIALGAEAQIQLVHTDRADARAILDACVAEIDRLENIFSLYRPNSTLCRLNRDGRVTAPELEFVELLASALQVSRDTDGAFDVTVQPLWEFHASRSPAGHDAKRALELVGFDRVGVSPRHIHLRRKGMSLTLNGIAQGYITDRVTDLLRRSGFENVLVHLGETFGAGLKTDGEPWRALIEGTHQTRELTDCALATSGTWGASPTAHLFDPRTGHAPRRYDTVSVSAPTATIADALSTAFHFMTPDEIHQTLSRHQRTAAILVEPSGRIQSL